MKNHPQFSVVIPTLNEEKYLPRLLEDLSQQTTQNFEVIVVDAQSEDATQAKAQSFANHFPLTVLTSKKRHVSHQRNLGALSAKGAWVIFMDADNELPEYFMQGIAYQLAKKPTTDAFTCWVDIAEDEDRTIKHLINLFIELGSLLPNRQAMGGLIGCKKTVLKEHQFNESQLFLEDGAFIREVCKAGYTFRIFREPKWYFSMRRMKKEGTLKLFTAMTRYQLQYFLGADFSKESSTKHYPMLGGSYYEENEAVRKNPDFFFLQRMQDFIMTAPKKQLEQAKRILKTIKEYEF